MRKCKLCIEFAFSYLTSRAPRDASREKKKKKTMTLHWLSDPSSMLPRQARWQPFGRGVVGVLLNPHGVSFGHLSRGQV